MATPASIIASFMSGYVNRINQATLSVPIRAVRIGGARYSRLAQINLRTRIITFSRYAVHNVPERGRRYLVIHELTHVVEPSHNRRFWEIVARFEPDYKSVDKEIVAAFRRNVRQAELAELLPAADSDVLYRMDDVEADPCHVFDIGEDESGAWSDRQTGVVCGGSW